MTTRALTTTVLCALALVSPAGATPPAQPCGEDVIADWTDGRIDGVYAPRCYGEALESLPEDMRAYTTAADDISQALRARVRQSRPPASRAQPAESTATASLPFGLLAAGTLALVLLVAGLTTLGTRWLRRVRLAHRRPVGQW
jgi:hypothetical protein